MAIHQDDNIKMHQAQIVKMIRSKQKDVLEKTLLVTWLLCINLVKIM